AMAAARRSVLREGVVAGLIGAVVVAVWFLFFDLARGRPFLTPGLLGGAVFRGTTTPIGLEITVANVLGYTLIHGLAFIGAAVVALWFLAIDTIQGEPLRTPKLLGMALLRQSAPTAAVLSYTVFHGLAFVVVGMLGSLLIAGAERQPLFVFALVIFFTAFEVFFFGAVVILAKWVLDELAGWTIFVGNLLSAAAMLGYFFKGHRTLARRLTE